MVLTGTPNVILGESCATSIKDFAIFPPHQKKKKIKAAEEVSYASILKDLKERVKPEKQGVTVQGVRETRSGDLLVELKCSADEKGRLNSSFCEVFGHGGSIRYLIPWIEVEISEIEPNIEAEDVEEAIKDFFDHGSICVLGGLGHRARAENILSGLVRFHYPLVTNVWRQGRVPGERTTG